MPIKNAIQKIAISHPIGNLYRPSHAQILVKQGEFFVLGKKSGFYPEGFARMLGGGINPNENPDLAATREIQEETGLKINPSQLIKIATVTTKAKIQNLDYFRFGKTSKNSLQISKKHNYKTLKTINHIYFLEIGNSAKLLASDDISELAYYSFKEFEELVESMKNMTGLYKGDKFVFDWKDYGKMYHYHHFLALRCADKMTAKK